MLSLIRIIYGLLTVSLSLSFSSERPETGTDIPIPCTEKEISIVPGSEYYSIELVTTKNTPEVRQATGTATVYFERNPFGISISSNGSFVHRLKIQLKKIRKPESGRYVAWITTPNLDKIALLDILDEHYYGEGTVDWNKYLVVITKEDDIENLDNKWKGPIVLRGISRSGLMHTMAGHGPFENDPCDKYGY